MQKVEIDELSIANAGNFQPDLLTRLKSILYVRKPFYVENVTGILNPELVDISFYQATADFNVMKNGGIKGAIIRAGQRNWPDSKAEIFMTNAKANNMPFGSYWFYDSRAEPRDQAELWAETLGEHDTKLWCWADYEENYGGAHKGWRKFYDFLEYCKLYMPFRKFGIYTGYYYWVANSPNPITQPTNLNYFAQYPLWLAWYANNISYVKIPKPWDRMLLWQKTDNGDGTYLGVGSLNIDMNEFIGTLEEYNQTFEINDSGNGGSTVLVIKGTAKGNVRIRQSPAGATYNPERYLYLGDSIEADRNEAQWLHITKINGIGVSYETWASAGTTQQYISWDWVEVPNPDPDPEPEPVEEYILYVKDGVIRKFIPE